MSEKDSKIRALIKVFGTILTLNIIVILGMTYFTPGVRGSGVLTTRTFDLDQFNHVTLEGVGTARITIDESQFFEITTDENMYSLLDIGVNDGKLVVRNKEEIRPSVLMLTIRTPYLRGIELAGNPTIEVPGISGDLFSIGIRGNGTVYVSGGVDHLDVNITGNGLVQAMDLVAIETEVAIEGAGDVEVQSTKRLVVNCRGSGNVLYAGDPSLDGECIGTVEQIR